MGDQPGSRHGKRMPSTRKGSGIQTSSFYANGVKLRSPASRSARRVPVAPMIEPQRGSTKAVGIVMAVVAGGVDIDMIAPQADHVFKSREVLFVL